MAMSYDRHLVRQPWRTRAESLTTPGANGPFLCKAGEVGAALSHAHGRIARGRSGNRFALIRSYSAGRRLDGGTAAREDVPVPVPRPYVPREASAIIRSSSRESWP